MAGFWERLFGTRSRALALARSAELRGDLARAAVLYERAGRDDEVARVRRVRAMAILAATANVPLTASRRPPLLEAAADLEALGDFARASDAYARAHDVEGQARALARAGEIDRLDDLLEADRSRERAARTRRSGHEEFDLLVASGRRREAHALARASSDAGLRRRGEALHAKRLAGPIVPIVVRGHAMDLVLGDRVVLGRAVDAPASHADGRPGGAIAIASVAVSRRHVAIERGEGGEPQVRDLGSRHGTSVEGRALQGAAPIGQGVALRLGGEVPCVVRPAGDWPGAVSVEIAGARYVAPLGPAAVGVGAWTLACGGEDGDPGRWVELATGDAPPCFAGGLRLAPRVALLAGDALSAELRGEPVVVFGEPS